MSLPIQILIAVCLDLVLGDPHNWPHPVKVMGKLARASENFFRSKIDNEKLAGTLSVLLIVVSVFISSLLFISLCHLIHPIIGSVVSIYLLYTCLAIRDLMTHSRKVFMALSKNQLELARRRVRFLVGRETKQLEESEVIRATVESVAENTVDGVTAPLFFALLGGAPGALVYKAINTMDSLFGYKNQKYEKFGWASAKLDDLANFVPSRLTAPLVPLAAVCLRQKPLKSLRILFRDGRKHPSPNAGLTEAAFAGAMGIQLGGTNTYFGKVEDKPRIGDSYTEIVRQHIRTANALMFLSSVFFLVLSLTVWFFVRHHWHFN